MPKSYIFIVPSAPVFNKQEVPQFENLTREDSSMLSSTLYMNYKDLLTRSKNGYEVVYFFDEKDRDFLPEEFCAEDVNKSFIKCSEGWDHLSAYISRKIMQDSTNILILFSHTIGITPARIDKYFNLLNHEDRNILVGKSACHKVSLMGINYYEPRIFEGLSSCYIQYSDFLQHVNKLDNFLFIVEGFNTVESFQDFRKLYKVLSTRESIEFCSHEIHELFTHLFIEYKELL